MNLKMYSLIIPIFKAPWVKQKCGWNNSIEISAWIGLEFWGISPFTTSFEEQNNIGVNKEGG